VTRPFADAAAYVCGVMPKDTKRAKWESKVVVFVRSKGSQPQTNPVVSPKFCSMRPLYRG
jgi:hypothetical protein